MNPEDVAKILRRLDTVESNYGDLKSKVAALRINEQSYIKANTPIAPGFACKVAFDMNGIILRGDKLQIQDIPELPVDHVTGLRQMISDKASKKDVEKIQKSIDSMMPKKGKAVGTGTKVNFDENGLVVSVADLLAEDIPMLPMDKIEGLSDIINFLKSHHTEDSPAETAHRTVMASTYCKVTCDEYGHIIKGERLTSDDIPHDIISKLNVLESRIPTLASQQSVDALTKMVSRKVDANPSITPGTYCKVRVDSKGFVTGGDKLSKGDLPELGIKDITGLHDTLMDKADREAFLALSETVSKITEAISKVGELSGVKNTLESMASKSSVAAIDTQVKSLHGLVDKLLRSMPADTIADQLTEISSQISTISGRLATVEKKIGVPSDH